MKELNRYDGKILALVAVLTCIGLTMVFSASSVVAAKRYHDGFYYLKRQGTFIVIGVFAMYCGMRIDYRKWRSLAVPALFACVALLTIVLIPGIGSNVGGSSRWLRILPGVALQPSELAKVVLIFYMAYSLDKKQDKVKQLSVGFIPYMVVLAIMLGLLLKQPDLGSSIVIATIAITMLAVAGARLKHLVSIVLIALPLVYYAVMHTEYRKRRILAFLNPWADPQNTGFQIIQSWYAFAQGGIFGVGLGEGKQKLFYLPEAHTDFVFAVAGEELGFVGVVIIIALFMILVLKCINVALNTSDMFGKYLAFGISLLIGVEAFVNLSVVMGLLPTKGLALPFLSYGGSSLVVTLFAVGVLLNISKSAKQ